MRYTWSAALLSILLASGCRRDEQPQPVPPGRATVSARAVNAFGLDLYHQLAGGPDNLFFCPVGISTALSMTWAGMDGATADEAAAVLHLAGSRNQALADCSALLKGLAGSDSTLTLEQANRLWGQKGFSFRPTFIRNMQQFFDGGFETLDFRAQPDQERQVINNWVAEHTGQKIQDLLSPTTITKDTRLVLTNAVYFLGDWSHPFPEERTTGEEFFPLASPPVRLPTMKLTRNLPYFADDQVALVALPYQGAELDFILLLPRRKDGLSAVEKNLTVEGLQALLANLNPRSLDLWLPRLDLSQTFNLNRPLQRMGLKQAFVAGEADFSGLSDQPGLSLSSVVHQSFLKVDEHGTEAAAATGITIGVTSMPAAPTAFHADHPFLFLIRQKESGVILFLGRFLGP